MPGKRGGTAGRDRHRSCLVPAGRATAATRSTAVMTPPHPATAAIAAARAPAIRGPAPPRSPAHPDFPAVGDAGPGLLGQGQDLPGLASTPAPAGEQRRQRVRLLRRSAVRQRPAALRPPAHRLRQGRRAALPDDARPSGRAPVRLGHPRAAGRGRGRAPARASSTSPRSTRWASRRSTTPAATRCCATPTSGRTTSPGRPAGSTSTTTTRPSTWTTWNPSCGPSRRCGTRV